MLSKILGVRSMSYGEKSLVTRLAVVNTLEEEVGLYSCIGLYAEKCQTISQDVARIKTEVAEARGIGLRDLGLGGIGPNTIRLFNDPSKMILRMYVI